MTMKRFVFYILLLFSFYAIAQTNRKEVYVKPYTKSDGTQVQGHYRTAPNSTNIDNFSTKPNTNPHTGKPGYIEPDNKNYTKPTYTDPYTTSGNTSNSINYNIPQNPEPIYNTASFTDYNLYNSSYDAVPLNLSLNELIALCNKADWDGVNEYLLKKGWEYHESAKGDDTHYNKITWSFNKDNYSDKAQGWFYLYTYEGLPNKIVFNFFNKQSYNTIKNGVTAAGLKLVENSIEDNEIITKYAGSNYSVEINTAKKQKDEGYDENSITAYTVTVIKKSGVYDDDNGLKKTYYNDGTIEKEFYLKDGKLNGVGKAYYSNGQLSVYSNFINGKKQGTSKEYDEEGNTTAEYNYINDEISGPYKIYKDGKLKMTGSTLNGEKNGKFIEFNEEGLINRDYTMKTGVLDGLSTEYYFNKDNKLAFKVSGLYINDLKTGVWQTVKILEKGIEIINSETYLNGEKDGFCKEVLSDSVIFANYKNGILNGPYKVYRNLTTMLFGGLSADTTNAPLVTVGTYIDGSKSGNWKYYFLDKTVKSEGRYYNDLKSGEWKYYFNTYVNSKGIKLPYSGILFLVENYQEGKLSGKQTRYAFLKDIKTPCDTSNNRNVNPLDTCHQKVYEKIFETSYYKDDELHGPFEQKDSAGIVVLKGNFLNGKKDGLWLEGFSRHDFDDKPFYAFFRGSYSKGLETGIWDEYTREDYIHTKYNYYNGELNGKTVHFNTYNKRTEEKIFEDGILKNLDIYDSLGVNLLRSYEIYDNEVYSLKCKKTSYYTDGRATQVYTLKKNDATPIDHKYFEFLFYLKTGKESDGTSGYMDGAYKFFDLKGNILIEGAYYKKEQIGVWKYYHYDENIIVEKVFSNNIGSLEKYSIMSSGELFSGKFVKKGENKKVQYEIKISDGLRQGKSKYYDEKGDLVKTEKYEKGILEN